MYNTMKLAALLLCYSLSLAAAGCDTKDQSFDFLSLVMQYPPTAGHNISHFTLHGMWPSRTGSRENTYPCTCNSQTFDESVLKPIMDDMNAYWPSFGSTNSHFWDHEWTKHGTCAEALGPLNSQFNFFSNALKLRASAGVMAGLAKAGITPSDTQPYKAAAILAAAKAAVGGTVSLGCQKRGGAQFLADVAVCHDKTLKVIDCSTSVVAPNNDPCDYSDPIIMGTGTGPSPGPSPGPAPPGPAPSNVCVPGEHGPACKADGDCVHIPGCVRCAHSGFCTCEKATVAATM